MDQKELIDRLRRDPKAVQSLMTSADGQRLMQLLSGGDGGRTLQQAAGEAAAGNTLQMAQMLKSVMSTPPCCGASGTVCRDREEDGSVSEMDEKLNTLLSDPGSMARIMQLAQQLSGTMGGAEKSTPEPPPPPPAGPADQTGGGTAGFGGLGGLDPALLGKLLPLAQEYGRSNSASMQLLNALRPFLKPEKQGKVERAAHLARLIHLGKKFLSEWEG